MRGEVRRVLEVERLLGLVDYRTRALDDRVAKLWGDALAVASWAGTRGTAAPAGILTVQVLQGCNGVAMPAIAGLTEVLLYSGGTLVATQPTDATGTATFSGLAAGSYSATAQGAGAAAGRWVPNSGNGITYPGGSYFGGTFSLGTAAAGYTCWHDCPIPVKQTLALSDSNGSHLGLLVWDSVSGTFPGCYTKSLTSGGALLAHGACSNAAVASPIAFSLVGTGANLSASTLSVSGFACDLTNYQPTQGTCSSSMNMFASPAPTLLSYQCWPLVLTFGGINFPQAGLSLGSLLSSGTNLVVTE